MKARIELWFAWKIVLLLYCKQQRGKAANMAWRCDLLEKSYFCCIANNIPTVRATSGASCDLLEKSYFCCIANNRRWALPNVALSCDLLEKSYFCCIANNTTDICCGRRYVVICLKNRTFAVLQTTIAQICVKWNMLWFAWKIVLLLYCKQQFLPERLKALVVICLKNRTFAVLQTTYLAEITCIGRLWFAWKIVLLLYCKQLTKRTIRQACRCDLLEKSYFCCIANNNTQLIIWTSIVVICLKNRTFAVLQTTSTPPWRWPRQLWFAWKIVLLLYCKQLLLFSERLLTGCDLLEKSYFCCIANNYVQYHPNKKGVVICLKNRTFAVLQTTGGWGRWGVA